MEIVGLKQKVDTDINKLIAKFVGVKVRKFIEEIDNIMLDYLKYLYGFKVDEDYIIEHFDEQWYIRKNMLFRTRVLLSCKNCVRCRKNKRKMNLHCYTCDRVEFQEFEERCIKNGWGDGCD